MIWGEGLAEPLAVATTVIATLYPVAKVARITPLEAIQHR